MIEEELPLRNALDSQILMHRDAHFGGNFDVMLDYYNKGGVGVCQDFSIEQIEALQIMEQKAQENLASMMLTGADAEVIARSRETYKRLRDLYEDEQASRFPLLIADLIFAEEHAQEAMDAIVKEGSDIVPSLIEVMGAADLHDPLFPGYGQAPRLAAECLGQIGDKRAIIALFEAIGEGDFFDEDTALHALRSIGDPAKEFLLKVLPAKPLTIDNERAAIAAIAFKDTPEVAEACFDLLQDPEVAKNELLSTYLILACEGLREKRPEFRTWAEKLPRHLGHEAKTVINSWD